MRQRGPVGRGLTQPGRQGLRGATGPGRPQLRPPRTRPAPSETSPGACAGLSAAAGLSRREYALSCRPHSPGSWGTHPLAFGAKRSGRGESPMRQGPRSASALAVQLLRTRRSSRGRAILVSRGWKHRSPNLPSCPSSSLLPLPSASASRRIPISAAAAAAAADTRTGGGRGGGRRGRGAWGEGQAAARLGAARAHWKNTGRAPPRTRK